MNIKLIFLGRKHSLFHFFQPHQPRIPHPAPGQAHCSVGRAVWALTMLLLEPSFFSLNVQSSSRMWYTFRKNFIIHVIRIFLGCQKKIYAFLIAWHHKRGYVRYKSMEIRFELSETWAQEMWFKLWFSRLKNITSFSFGNLWIFIYQSLLFLSAFLAQKQLQGKRHKSSVRTKIWFLKRNALISRCCSSSWHSICSTEG